jgi:hypothetical protein
MDHGENCIKMHYSLYSSHNIVRVTKSRRMKWAGCAAHMGDGRGVHRILFGRPKGKRLLGRHRCRWEDNIKMDFRETGISGMKDGVWWQAFVNMVMNLWVP